MATEAPDSKATVAPTPFAFDFAPTPPCAQTVPASEESGTASASAAPAEEEESAADAVAKQLIAALIAAFKEKEGRDPTSEECEEMLGELTEERIEALMTGQDDPAAASTEAVEEDGEEDDNEGAEGEEEEGDDEEDQGEGEAEAQAGKVAPVAGKELLIDENLAGNKRGAEEAGLPSSIL